MLDFLRQAIEDLHTGTIEVTSCEQSIGQIVLVGGRIAWATCRGQSETLGIFLWRLGQISRKQLAHAQQVFKASGGKKKLGAILEEEGFMSRPVLRRCLLLHIRSAFEGMLAPPETAAAFQEKVVVNKADEKILFSLEEVLPQDLGLDLLSEWTGPDNTLVRSWRRRTRENAILESLTTLPGYLAAGLATASGDLITAHFLPSENDPNLIATLVTTVLESCSRLARGTDLGQVACVMTMCDEGHLITRWLDDHQRHFFMLLVTKTADPLHALRFVGQVTPDLQEWLLRSGEFIYHERLAQASVAQVQGKPEHRGPGPAEPAAGVAPRLGQGRPFDQYGQQAMALGRDPNLLSEVQRRIAASSEPDIFSEVRRRALPSKERIMSSDFVPRRLEISAPPEKKR